MAYNYSDILPKGFIQQIANLIPNEAEDFFNAMMQPSAISLKINRRKIQNITDTGYAADDLVKWCRSGFYLSERPKFTLNPLLHAGAFYVQDASSMIYEYITEKIVTEHLSTQTDLCAIDLCAAPGGKTTSIINSLPDDAFVVTNEFMPKRATILKENLLKWGFPNILITNSSTDKLTCVGEQFDIVAVDAPCSGEGMMRKEEMAIEQWSPGLIRQCADLQHQILQNAVELLKPGGCLIYSTCTFNAEEDELQVERLINEHHLSPIDLQIPQEWGILKGINTEIPCYRFMPHATRGEGLFVALLQKPGVAETQRNAKSKIIATLEKKAKVICNGIPQTEVKGKDLIPRSEWALSTDFDNNKYPSVDVELDTALSYLRHEALRLSADIPKGFVVIKFQGIPLGFVKNIGSRANNLFPAEWRIRNL